jgi:hypothetical protein
MTFKHRQKKTLKRNRRRFLKRKSAKTYRRSLTKRRSMRGGDSTTWDVNVKYMDYADDHDYSESSIKSGPGTFTFLYVPGQDLYNDNNKVGRLTLTNKPGKNYVDDTTWKPSFIPSVPDGVDVYMGQKTFGSHPKQGDKKILSFEKIEQDHQKQP